MSTAAANRFLDVPAMSALEHMRFATRHRIEGTYSGRHKSRHRGGSGEFVDYREYSAGEDLRRLDWKVLARTGKAYIRLFQDETNLLCTLALDVSGSMRFGARSEKDLRGSKLEYGQYLATALSHVINRGQDQVGAAVLTDTLQEFVPPGGTLMHLARVQETIAKIETQPTTKMSAALRQLFERSERRGVLLLISDFLVDDLRAVFGVLRLFRHRPSEVILLHLIHPDEERLPDGAAYRFVGLEGEGRIDCSPGEIRELYRQRFEEHLATVRTLALADGCDYRRVSTAVPYLQTLGSFLVERSG
jgi:uncharacterized protein (DUF58 family)